MIAMVPVSMFPYVRNISGRIWVNICMSVRGVHSSVEGTIRTGQGEERISAIS